MKKGIKRHRTDAAGIYGAHVTIDPDEATPEDVASTLKAMTPAARIEALRNTPALAERVQALQAWHDEVFKNGAKSEVMKRTDGRHSVRFPKVDEQQRMALLAAIQQDEMVRDRINATPHIEKSVNYSTVQSERARNPRGTIVDGNDKKFSMVAVARMLHTQYPYLTPADLWPHFLAVLDERGLNPKETIALNSRQDSMKAVEFDVPVSDKYPVGRRELKIASFRAALNKQKT